MTERTVTGDFHVIKMGGLFHVVFRPDDDPEWFRIIGTFYTYERAYCYCDVERCMFDDGECQTSDEEVEKLRCPPAVDLPDSQGAVLDLVRHVYDSDKRVVPHPVEDFSEQPADEEEPKAYRDRTYADAIRRLGAEVDAETVEEVAPAEVSLPAPSAEPDLTDNQWSVLQFFNGRAKIGETIEAPLKDIARESGVAIGSTSYFLDTLQRKGFIDIVEPGVYRLNDPATREDKGPKCETCGGSCTPGSKQCKACYRGELKGLPAEVIAELSVSAQNLAASP